MAGIKGQGLKDYEHYRIPIQHLVDQNFNKKEVGKMLNIPDSTFRHIVKKLGIKFNKKGSNIFKNEQYFDIIDTQEKAYILGFIIADGCISIEPKKKCKTCEVYAYSKRLTFCNSIDDLDVLEKIKDEISPTSKLKVFTNTKGAKNRKPQVSLRINSSLICNTLMNVYNINPRKTKDTEFYFDFSLIPKDLVRHFIRGFFDGDGWISKDGGIGVVATSKKFLEQIANICNESISLNYTINTTRSKNMEFHQVHFSSLPHTSMIDYGYKDRLSIKYLYLKEFYSFLYDDATIYLNRKYEKFRENIKKRTPEYNQLTLTDILNGEGWVDLD